MHPVDRNYLFAAAKANGGMHRCTNLSASESNYSFRKYYSIILLKRRIFSFFFFYLRIMDFNDLIINPIFYGTKKLEQKKKNYGYIGNFKLEALSFKPLCIYEKFLTKRG